jgi:hypothetical protein
MHGSHYGARAEERPVENLVVGLSFFRNCILRAGSAGPYLCWKTTGGAYNYDRICCCRKAAAYEAQEAQINDVRFRVSNALEWSSPNDATPRYIHDSAESIADVDSA